MTQPYKKVQKEIGYRIQERRNYMGLTQKDLAERVDVAIQTISYIETGRRGMSCKVLSDICEVLQVTPNEILIGKVANPENTELQNLLNSIEKPLQSQVERNLITYINTVTILKATVKKQIENKNRQIKYRRKKKG